MKGAGTSGEGDLFGIYSRGNITFILQEYQVFPGMRIPFKSAHSVSVSLGIRNLCTVTLILVEVV
jgi:hypothetical protein